MSKVRYVFDTNVIISSLLFEGSNPDLAIRYALQNGNILFSLELIEEIDEVLSRAKFRKYITDSETTAFLRFAKCVASRCALGTYSANTR
ncbi:MAG: hypothetical protein RLZZ339_2188 [Cyanobacteriota bacterium]